MITYSIIIATDEPKAHKGTQLATSITSVRYCLRADEIRNLPVAIYDGLVTGARVYVIKSVSPGDALMNNVDIVIDKALGNPNLTKMLEEFNFGEKPDQVIDTLFYTINSYRSLGNLQMFNLL